MTRQSVLLLATAAAVAIAWTAVASAAFLWFFGGTWEVWEPGPFWNSPYFAHGLRWTWAWFSYVATASTRATYGTTLAYTGLAAAAVVGISVFRVSQLMGYFGSGNRLSLYGKTEFAGPKEMKANKIATTRRLF